MISKAQIKRAIEAMEEAGHPVKAIRLEPNGSVVLLTEGLEVDTAATTTGDWLELVGMPASDPWAVDPAAIEAARIQHGGRPRRKR